MNVKKLLGGSIFFEKENGYFSVLVNNYFDLFPSFRKGPQLLTEEVSRSKTIGYTKSGLLSPLTIILFYIIFCCSLFFYIAENTEILLKILSFISKDKNEELFISFYSIFFCVFIFGIIQISFLVYHYYPKYFIRVGNFTTKASIKNFDEKEFEEFMEFPINLELVENDKLVYNFWYSKYEIYKIGEYYYLIKRNKITKSYSKIKSTEFSISTGFSIILVLLPIILLITGILEIVIIGVNYYILILWIAFCFISTLISIFYNSNTIISIGYYKIKFSSFYIDYNKLFNVLEKYKAIKLSKKHSEIALFDDVDIIEV